MIMTIIMWMFLKTTEPKATIQEKVEKVELWEQQQEL